MHGISSLTQLGRVEAELSEKSWPDVPWAAGRVHGPLVGLVPVGVDEADALGGVLVHDLGGRDHVPQCHVLGQRVIVVILEGNGIKWY